LRFIREGKQEDLISFIQAFDIDEYSNYRFRALRSHLFKGYCHYVLSKGGKFSIRSLEEENSTKMKIEELIIKNCDKVYLGGK
jgi:hypothetical protein